MTSLCGFYPEIIGILLLFSYIVNDITDDIIMCYLFVTLTSVSPLLVTCI
jgi:hypothetical protein